MSSNDKGFTLIEILIVAFMLSLVLMSVYSLYSTSQRSSYTQDEVVEVQQNLRIAMDNITRDIRNAGFMISQMRDASLQWQSMQPATNAVNSYTQGIGQMLDNSANTPTLPQTADALGGVPGVHADMLIMNSGSPYAFYASARITTPQTGISNPFTVASAESVDNFKVGDMVRVYNPAWHDESSNISPNLTPRAQGGQGTILQVDSLGTTTITLVRPTGAADNDPTNTSFKRGDIISKVSVTGIPYVNTIQYCLGPATNCAPAIDPSQCSSGPADKTMCLVRITNTDTAVIASKISGLQFTYLLDDGTEVSTTAPPADLGAIRAVRITLTGQTANAVDLSSGATGAQYQKTRTMTSVVKLQNRYILK